GRLGGGGGGRGGGGGGGGGGVEQAPGPPRRADGETVGARPHALRSEHDRLRADAGALDLRVADGGGRLQRGQVLPHQARLGASGADAVDAEGRAADEREGERRPEDLAAALAAGSVDGEHHPFTHTICRSVWTISTRSFWASITASMDLYALGVSSMTSASFRPSMPAVAS